MNAHRAFDDVCSAFGAPPLAAHGAESVIGPAVEAGLQDHPRSEVLHRWAQRHASRERDGEDLAPSLVVLAAGGTALWVEPAADGRDVLAYRNDGWEIQRPDRFSVRTEEASLAPARRRAVIAHPGEGQPAGNVAGPVLAVIAALAVGTGARALVEAVAYARRREQFGRPIGTFQAVSHRLAQAFRDLVAAQELLLHAENQRSEHSKRTELVLVLARHQALKAATAAVNAAVQTHGAEGFRFDSLVGAAFRQVQEDRLVAAVSPHERSMQRAPLIDAVKYVRRFST